MLFRSLRDAGSAALRRDGLSGGTFGFAADLRYRGQEHTIAVPVIGPEELVGSAAETRQRFNAQHDSRYGHAAPDQSIEIVNLRLVVTLARIDDAISRWLSTPWQAEPTAPLEYRAVVFDDPVRPVEARISWRPGLAAGTEVEGPAVIEEPNSTTFVLPGDHAVVDAWGNVVITVEHLG